MIALPLFALLLGFGLVYLAANGFGAGEVAARYTAIALLAGFDTILGGLRAWLTEQFDDLVFVTGFFANALLAAGLVYLGDQLGLETGLGNGRVSVIMIGAVVVFTGRILNNLAALRRMLIARWRSRHGGTDAPAEAAAGH